MKFKFDFVNKISIDNFSNIKTIHLKGALANCKDDCNAKIGQIAHATKGLQQYANELFDISFDYMWIASNFGTYSKNRPGFEKTFKELSDSSWTKGVEMIKYMGKRGVTHNFATKYTEGTKKAVEPDTYAQYEVQAMATALDYEKHLFTKANEIHKSISHPNKHSDNNNKIHYDAEVSFF